ncbi:hypothetical protein FHU10_2246 [Serratia fonticola]|jgi:hypothetical protein|uniref:Uncharacterized protein n=1 Tax=Serratia fonticola TaxID=47917 RepID=A0A559T539_SERFO|nr:hypothetical protein [Serratia fonticola]TQI77786.1 hypothetical protein FHU09_0206 [Serratia fonticola]TQI95219.1 hypothetical protein FHU11_0587 [Serratia fonticola]TVZ69716.1 hypothetical protein FHU10_2246 [Serratia fonticola]
MPWNHEIQQAITLLQACQHRDADNLPCPARGDEPGAVGTCAEKIMPSIILLNAFADVLPQHQELHRIGMVLEARGLIKKLDPGESYSQSALKYLSDQVMP